MPYDQKRIGVIRFHENFDDVGNNTIGVSKGFKFAKNIPMRLILVFAFVSLLSTGLINAQGHVPILTELEGDTLISRLEEEFKPFAVLSYKDARDIMYRELYNKNDSVFCVYTGHRVYLDPNTGDAVAYVFRNGDADGINCEHTYPQSLGAREGNARSDMHHLYPTRVAVNTTRSNLPFGEIDDNETLRWFYQNIDMNQIPSQHIDLYSEWSKSRFEPREDHKGNVARAIFYFATIYRQQADLAYFEEQRAELCKWHSLDPVDEREWTNNQTIATYQSNKPNPFILDCTLAYRCYCPDDPPCVPQTGVTYNLELPCNAIQLDSSGKRWSVKCDTGGPALIRILDLQGTEVFRINLKPDHNINKEINISRQLAGGMYVFHMTDPSTGKILAVEKFVVTDR